MLTDMCIGKKKDFALDAKQTQESKSCLSDVGSDI